MSSTAKPQQSSTLPLTKHQGRPFNRLCAKALLEDMAELLQSHSEVNLQSQVFSKETSRSQKRGHVMTTLNWAHRRLEIKEKCRVFDTLYALKKSNARKATLATYKNSAGEFNDPSSSWTDSLYSNIRSGTKKLRGKHCDQLLCSSLLPMLQER